MIDISGSAIKNPARKGFFPESHAAPEITKADMITLDIKKTVSFIFHVVLLANMD